MSNSTQSTTSPLLSLKRGLDVYRIVGWENKVGLIHFREVGSTLTIHRDAYDVVNQFGRHLRYDAWRIW